MLKRVRDWAERRHWTWLVVLVDVQERFGRVRGGVLAASVTLAVFLSLFPLLVVAVAVLGFVSTRADDLPAQVVALLGLPPGEGIADQVNEAIRTAERSRRAASVVGLAGLFWTGLGVVGAMQSTYNGVWGVEGRGLRDRLFGLLWLVGAVVLFAGSFMVTAAIGLLPAFFAPLSLVAGFGIAVALWLWSAQVLGNRTVAWRELLPGAVLGAAGFEILKLVGSLYVPRTVASASALYGSIGLVLAILGWLFFFGRLLVYSAVLNVVLYERTHGVVDVVITAPALPREESDDGQS